MLLELLLVLCVSLAIFYLWYVSENGYWRKQGVPHLKPEFPFGNVADIFLMKKTTGEVFRDIYRRCGPGQGAMGYFGLCWPALMLRDTELIKTVLVKEFPRFHDNGFQISMATDPMMGINPFVTKGNKWKTIRGIHTPTHTVSRLKAMFPDMIPPCKAMVHYLRRHGENVESLRHWKIRDKIIELHLREVCKVVINLPMAPSQIPKMYVTNVSKVKEICGYYTMDAVGASGFGMTGNSFLGVDHGFRKALSGQLFSTSFKPNMASICAIFAPTLNNIFNFRVIPQRTEDFFVKMVEEVVEHRKKNGIRRNDLMQQLIDDGYHTNLEMAGHGMTLFLDGNETSSIAMAFALYELAAHPQVQQQLRQEIFTAGISTTSGITYDKLHALNYLDMVMNETLRLHPPVQVLTRVATEECCLTTSTGQEFKLRKGMLVTVPVLALHTDPALHNDPTKFLPERFSPEVRKHMDKFSFLPFGEGPRICLGFRFGMTEAKLGVVALLTEFEVRLSPLMLNKEIQLNPMSTFLHTAKNGLWLQFVPLQKNN